MSGPPAGLQGNHQAQSAPWSTSTQSMDVRVENIAHGGQVDYLAPMVPVGAVFIRSPGRSVGAITWRRAPLEHVHAEHGREKITYGQFHDLVQMTYVGL